MEANYGVMAGGGLVILDVDSYRDSVDSVPEPIKALPDTFTAKSPHGGEHRYYVVKDDTSNAKANWGEIRAEDQYVVGPGSELDNCDKEWHDCTEPNTG